MSMRDNLYKLLTALKKIVDSIIGRDDAKFQRQNAAFDLSLQMANRIGDGLIKLLLVYRFTHSTDDINQRMVEEWRQNIFPDKKTLNEKDITNMVEIMFESMPVMERLQFPEATIATISEAYHNILRSGDISDEELIYKELDRQRNATHLLNFGDQKLNLKNYIIHVMKNEDENDVMNWINFNLLKKQIQIADEFGTDHELRGEIAFGSTD